MVDRQLQVLLLFSLGWDLLRGLVLPVSIFVMVNGVGVIFEDGVIAVRKVQNVVGQWQDRGNVRNVHAFANMDGKDLGVRVSCDVGLDWHRDVSEVERAAVLMRVEECQVHSFMATRKG